MDPVVPAAAAAAVTVDPETGEIRRPVTPGVHLWSATRKWNDGVELQTPIGGTLVDWWEGDHETMFKVAEIWRGKIVYHTLEESDVDWNDYTGLVNKTFVRQLAVVMNREMGARRADHLPALLALSRAVGDV